jgi:hypothetical protein
MILRIVTYFGNKCHLQAFRCYKNLNMDLCKTKLKFVKNYFVIEISDIT